MTTQYQVKSTGWQNWIGSGRLSVVLVAFFSLLDSRGK